MLHASCYTRVGAFTTAMITCARSREVAACEQQGLRREGSQHHAERTLLAWLRIHDKPGSYHHRQKQATT